MYFQYGEKEIAYLGQKDRRLGEAMERIGRVEREVEADLFASVVHHIIGQQISTAAQRTIWQRMQATVGTVTAQSICDAGTERLQAVGISFRKVEYIQHFALRVLSGEFDIDGLHDQSDREVIEALSSLKGIGVWTAEMLLLFCMQRPDVLSFGDLAIHRGLRMLYHHRSVKRELFEKYRRRYSPYGSVASLYLWAIAGGAIPEMKDYAPRAKKA